MDKGFTLPNLVTPNKMTRNNEIQPIKNQKRMLALNQDSPKHDKQSQYNQSNISYQNYDVKHILTIDQQQQVKNKFNYLPQPKSSNIDFEMQYNKAVSNR